MHEGGVLVINMKDYHVW